MILSKMVEFLISNYLNQNDYPSILNKIQYGPTKNLHKKPIKKILVTISPSFEVLDYARKMKSNLIICVNPLISLNEASVEFDESYTKKLFLLSSSNIILYVINSILFDESLANSLGLRILDNIYLKERKCNNSLNLVGQKCAFYNEEMNNSLLIQNLGKNFNCKIKYSIDRKESKRKIALIPTEIFGKSGIDLIKNIHKEDCKLIITSNISLDSMEKARDYNLDYIIIDYYELIKPTIVKFKNVLAMEFPNLDFELLITEQNSLYI